MKFLIDTNIFIPLEPTAEADFEAGTSVAFAFVRRAQEAGHQVYVHPASREDIARDRSDARRRLRERLFEKYPALPFPPTPTPDHQIHLGHAEPNTNDWVDNALLAAIAADAVDWLVSDDEGVHRKARRLGRGDRVLSLADAKGLTEDLFAKDPPPPPAVRTTVAHDLRDVDPIFTTFRADYPGFDDWLSRCKRQHRKAFVIDASDGYGGVAILKDESPSEYGLSGKVLKLCSFKVSEVHSGRRYGELLLKPIFGFAEINGFDWIYVTVLPKHERLVAFLEDFGFETLATETTERGEFVMAKPMTIQAAVPPSGIDALAFNRRYGPRRVRTEGVAAFVIPIQPRYHDLLFPEVQPQLTLQPGRFAAGNGLRKAYLCHSPTKNLPAGSNLFFYRSGDAKAVTVLGVIEEPVRSAEVESVARHVGTRTVYSYAEIQHLCRESPVLAIAFRQARILDHPIPLSDLVAQRILKGPPQSITRLSKEAALWLTSRIER